MAEDDENGGWWCPGPDLNRHGRNGRRILSPLRLPISPPGQRVSQTCGKKMEAEPGIEPRSTALQAAA
jgi:hypothetical protein